MKSLKLASIGGTILKSNFTRLDKPYKLNFSITYWCQSRCTHCVKPDEIILGDNKQIQQLQVGSHTIGQSGLNEIKKKFDRTYSGPLIRIKASGLLPIEVTPEHPVLVRTSQVPERPGHINYDKPEWKEARFILPKLERKNGDYLIVPKIPREANIVSLSLRQFTNENGARVAKSKHNPLELLLDEETAWLLGLFVAEGSTVAAGVRFSLNQKEVDLQEKVRNIAQKLGYKTSIVKTPTETLCTIGSRILSRAVDEWCEACAK